VSLQAIQSLAVTEPTAPRLYADLADWFHLLTAPEEYVEEAGFYTRVLRESCARPPRTVLELGSGGGNNASHMKAHFDMTLVDPSQEMLRISRELNPECEHIEGDMRDARLGRIFDAVFVHDAVSYLTSLEDLRAAMMTAFVHLASGGAALFVPDHVRESFEPATEHGGNDGPGRAMRYMEWTWDPDPSDDEYIADFAYLLREGSEVRVVHDRHQCGIFPRGAWMRLLAEVGFEPHNRPAEYQGSSGLEVFLGRKP
jgi:SAM-dependent methyltransferase